MTKVKFILLMERTNEVITEFLCDAGVPVPGRGEFLKIGNGRVEILDRTYGFDEPSILSVYLTIANQFDAFWSL